MELYKLLSTTENILKNNKIQKEWQVRVRKALTYVITVTYNQSLTKILVSINDCIVESRISGPFKLPIIIEGLEFTVSLFNGIFRLDVNQKNIEQFKEGFHNLLEKDEFQQIIVAGESLVAYCTNNNNQQIPQVNIKLITDHMIVVIDAVNRTTIPDYRIALEEQLQLLQNVIQVQQLQEEEQQQQQQQQLQQQQGNLYGETNTQQIEQNDDNTCIICLNKQRNYAPIPCGHMKYCEDCIQQCVIRKECSFCKQAVTSIMKIYN